MHHLTIRVLALTVVGLGAFDRPARADIFNLAASERGWVCLGSCGGFSNNGASLGNNYVAGAHLGAEFRDWFEFAIPTLTGGPLVSATLNLYEPSVADPVGSFNGHSGGTLSFAVYGLGAQPMIFTDVTTANPFGSVSTSSASNGTTVTITLNAVALAAIAADQVGNIFIGGRDSGESSSEMFDFGGTAADFNPKSTTILSLTTAPAPVPEPSSLALLAGVLLWAAARRFGRRWPLA